ncbi:adenosylcobinamide-GDP ribazoletransferase [Lysinibacillus sp. SGAir0095]|nr:adenosylcobinamide-GDP ribazoletransferase [Lysinibacillus sp. SGAir0095]
MKNTFIGFLLTFQFFSSLPIRMELPMNKKTVTAMYSMLPVLGLLMGSTISILYILNEDYLLISDLLFAILVVVAGIIMTGGLHLDGWIDTGDAYFSYQNQEKRLEILEDPRVGAFGAINLVVLLLLKIGFVFELLHKDSPNIIFYFIAVPFLSRLALQVYFITTNTVKEKGLAVYFKAQVTPKWIWITLLIYLLSFSILTFSFIGMFGFILAIGMLLFVFIFRKWTIKNFGGMTGDLIGALYEGIEVFLWGMLLFI